MSFWFFYFFHEVFCSFCVHINLAWGGTSSTWNKTKDKGMRVSYQKHISLSCLVTGPTNPPLWPAFLFAFARFLFDHCLVTSLLSFHMWLNSTSPSIVLVALPPLPGPNLGGHLQPSGSAPAWVGG